VHFAASTRGAGSESLTGQVVCISGSTFVISQINASVLNLPIFGYDVCPLPADRALQELTIVLGHQQHKVEQDLVHEGA